MDSRRSSPTPSKASTGITGFDEITGGGLPRGRITLRNADQRRRQQRPAAETAALKTRLASLARELELKRLEQAENAEHEQETIRDRASADAAVRRYRDADVDTRSAP